jgi:hypothetical protein
MLVFAQAVLVKAEGDGEDPGQRSRFLQVDLELAVAVADLRPLAPRLGPGLVEIADLLAGDGQTALDLGLIREQEAQA